MTFVHDGKQTDVYGFLSKDGFNSILTLINWFWEIKRAPENKLSDIVELDIKFQMLVDYSSFCYQVYSDHDLPRGVR